MYMHKRAQSPYILYYTQPHIHFTLNHILHHFKAQIQTSPVGTTLDNSLIKLLVTPNCRSSQDDMHTTAQAPSQFKLVKLTNLDSRIHFLFSSSSVTHASFSQREHRNQGSIHVTTTSLQIDTLHIKSTQEKGRE